MDISFSHLSLSLSVSLLLPPCLPPSFSQINNKNTHTYPWVKIKLKKLYPLTNCPFSLHPAPGNHQSTFSMHLTIPDTSRSRIVIICPIGTGLFYWHNIIILFLKVLRLNNNPLYIYITLCLCIHLLKEEHLGCFYFLAIVTNAAINMCV